MRVAIVILNLGLICSTLLAGNWPEFRGPTGQGHANAASLPLRWSETEHVRWKTAIPGEGWSSPVIWGDQIWMTTALNDGRSLRAICVQKATGKILFNKEIVSVEAPKFKHALNSYASPTPVIEEGRVYVSFGDYGNACLDTKTGEILWKTFELKLEHENGPGSSPILYKDLFILHCDGTNVQYLAALNKKDGSLAWRTDRSGFIDKAPPMKKAYSVPLVIQVRGRDQLISPAAEYVYAYEPLTGKELWYVKYPGFSNVPRPVYGEGLLFICTGFGKPEIWAIEPGLKGDLTASHVAWKVRKQAPAKPSPILAAGRLFMVSDNGIVSCLEPKTGKAFWEERIPGEYSASPIFGDGKLYFCNQQGLTTVIKPADEFTVLAENKLPDGFMASPAVSERAIFLRTKAALYRIEQ